MNGAVSVFLGAFLSWRPRSRDCPDDGKEAAVWIHDLGGTSSMRRLTRDARNRYPIWTADGERLVFQSDRAGSPAIYWQRADGSGTAERLTAPQSGEEHIPDSWSADGDRFLSTSVAGPRVSLWVYSLEERRATPLGTSQTAIATNAVFSPDGKWVAYTSREPRAPSVVLLQPYPGTGETHQVSTGAFPVWGAGGKELIFSEPLSNVFTVVGITTRPRLVFAQPIHVPRVGFMTARRGYLRSWDLSPDGARFVIVAEAGEAQPQIRVVLNWLDELRRRVPSR